jgi:superfamily II DNA or RNA helicase
MTRQELQDLRQKEAVQAVMDKGGSGTVNACVGFGKFFVSFKWLYALAEEGKINLGDQVMLVAETDARKLSLQQEAAKFLELKGKDVLEDFDIFFCCYQGRNSLEGYKAVILDEVHDGLTAKYHKPFMESTAYKLGLSGTIPENLSVFRQDLEDLQVNNVRQSDKATRQKEVTTYINKGQLLEVICPSVYNYSLERGIEEGLLSPFETVIVEHNLNDTVPYLKKWAKGDLTCTELEWYNIRDGLRKDLQKPYSMRRNLSMFIMPRFLYNLRSKKKAVKDLLSVIKGPTIIFGIEKSFLKNFTDNVVDGKNASALIEAFNKGEIDVVASAKKLKQGITLNKVQNCILVSYYSTPHDLEQKIGRIVRYAEGKTATLYIIVTKNTLEETWFRKMQIEKDYKGEEKKRLWLNIVRKVQTANILKILNTRKNEIQ